MVCIISCKGCPRIAGQVAGLPGAKPNSIELRTGVGHELCLGPASGCFRRWLPAFVAGATLFAFGTPERGVLFVNPKFKSPAHAI